MSCIDVTPLVLSDTFNTWFERTNEIISELNSISVRGITFGNSGVHRGLNFTDVGSCVFRVSLETGPFVGFVTGVDSSIYGTGDYSSPYKLTLVATGPTISASSVTGDDLTLISDTSDGGLFKLAPVTSFITKIQGGNNISVGLSGGIYTISYVQLSFSPSFSIPTISSTNNSGVSYEINETNGSLLDNGTLTFSLSNGGDVDHDGGTIVLSDGGRVNGYDQLAFISTDTLKSDTGVTIPYNAPSWFSKNTRSISFQATFNPKATSNPPGSVPYSGGPVTATRTIYFGWRFGGCDSTTLYTDASSFASALSGSLSDLLYNGSVAVWNEGSVNNASQYIFGDPTVERFFTVNVTSNSSYLYFVHTSTEHSSGYGWTPTLLTDNGSVVNNGLVSIGHATINSNKYEVWRSSNQYNTGTLTIGIK